MPHSTCLINILTNARIVLAGKGKAQNSCNWKLRGKGAHTQQAHSILSEVMPRRQEAINAAPRFILES